MCDNDLVLTAVSTFEIPGCDEGEPLYVFAMADGYDTVSGLRYVSGDEQFVRKRDGETASALIARCRATVGGGYAYLWHWPLDA